jgi:hypothetical protein
VGEKNNIEVEAGWRNQDIKYITEEAISKNDDRNSNKKINEPSTKECMYLCIKINPILSVLPDSKVFQNKIQVIFILIFLLC